MPQPDNILIYRLGSLGDTVVALPCFHLIRQLYPHRRIFLLTNEPVSGKAAPAMAILENSRLCDEAISYPVGTRSPGQLLKVRKAIGRIRPLMLVNLAAGRGWLKSLRDHFFFRSCGIRRVIGTPWARRALQATEGPDGYFESEAERLAARLSALGAIDVADPQAWDLRLTAAERLEALEWLPPGSKAPLAVSVGTKLPVKDWGEENWAKLLARLATELPGSSVVFLGAGDERARSEKLGGLWKERAVNLCGKVSPRVSAAVLERCRLFIGHDSGPMHLAAAAGIPTLGLFSWFNPPGQWFAGHRRWKRVKALYPPLPAGRWHGGVQMKRSDTEGIGLLRPEDVCHAAMELWQGEPGLPALAMGGRQAKSALE